MRTPARGGAAREQDLSSPWDVVWWPPLNAVVVAMAGVHQLWVVDLGAGTARPLAGTRGEGLRDGAADEALLAQPSGLAAAGDRLWFVDAETSALRWLELTADGAAVRTAVGAGLFDFGHVDGPADAALFQHPLGLCLLPDGSIAVFDTYNDAVRRYDPVNREVSTLATGVREPSGGVLADGALWVVESAAHQLVQPVTPGVVSHIARGAQQTARPETDLAPGPLALEVIYEAPAGQHLDERYGPSTRLVVTASPPELLVDGGGAGTDLSRKLQLAAAVPAGVLHVTASAASCDDEGEFPACHVTTQDWGIPVRVRPGAADRLGLVLRGIDSG
jgi:hypothetical protein